MKYIFLFFLISFSGAFIISNGLVLDTFRIRSSKKALNYSDSSEDIINFMERNALWKVAQNDSVPKVELLLREENKPYTWGSQIRYTIKVSDVKDGDSKYGEINGNEVLLKIEYFPIADEGAIKEKKKLSEKEHKGLTLMKRSTCFGCHADRTRLAGPSFSELAELYEKTSGNIKSLAGNISGGSSGIWGNSIMPAHPHLSEEESEYMADYILTQGAKKNSSILLGLEGTFRIREKPNDSEKGLYVVTASYVSNLNVRGNDSTVIRIE